MKQKTNRIWFTAALILTPILALYPQQALPKTSLMYSRATNSQIVLLLILIKLLIGVGCALVGVNYRRYVSTAVRVITAIWALLSLCTLGEFWLPIPSVGLFVRFYSDRTYLIFAFYLVLLLVSFAPNSKQADKPAAE